MQLFVSILIYVFLFAGVMLMVDAIAGFFRVAQGENTAAVERRLSSIPIASRATPAPGSLFRQEEAARPWTKYVPFYRSLTNLIETSGVEIAPVRTLVWMLLLGVVAFLGLTFIVPARFFVLSLAVAIFLGVGTVVVYLRRSRAKRLALFQEQLPDAIDLIIRSLKVGHPLSGALSVIAQELPAPVNVEFGGVFQEVSYGQDIATAITNLSKRVPVADLRYLAMAVQIQQESGGNLVESLSKLCAVIRERYRMYRKVKALTAEGRFSAWFLALFPVVMIMGIQAVKPDFYTNVMDFPYFPHLVVLTIVLLGVNVIAMRIVTTIKV